MNSTGFERPEIPPPSKPPPFSSLKKKQTLILTTGAGRQNSYDMLFCYSILFIALLLYFIRCLLLFYVCCFANIFSIDSVQADGGCARYGLVGSTFIFK